MSFKKSSKVNRNYWKAEEERIIQQWADKAQCYQWMHSKCREIYQSKNAWFTIPVIIISTITGTANFAQDRFSEDIKQYVVMGIGSMSIIAGIITTIYQFLKISELNEGHRVAAVSWGKFHNNLKTLVLRHPLDRLPPSQAIEMYQEEYDRLIEVSPVILKKIVHLFEMKFKKNDELIKPEICNKLNTTEVFQMSRDERQRMADRINKVKRPNRKLMNTFYDLNGRDPIEDELKQMSNVAGNHDIGIEDIQMEELDKMENGNLLHNDSDEELNNLLNQSDSISSDSKSSDSKSNSGSLDDDNNLNVVIENDLNDEIENRDDLFDEDLINVSNV
jgi:hypothetical protein